MLGVDAPESKGFVDKPVLLTGEPEVLATENGQEVFRTAVMLLVRMTSDLTVDIAAHPSRDSVRDLVKRFQIHKVAVVENAGSLDRFACVLNVGTRTTAGSPTIAVNSHGWLVRVTAQGVPISSDCSQTNAVGACAAACFGVSEVFKILIGLKPGRGEPLKGYEYSLWAYCSSANPGPALSPLRNEPMLLVGAGAIGNGVVHLLRALGIMGVSHVIDQQRFKKENLGTCLLMTPQDIGHSKAVVLSQLLPGAKAFEGSITDFKTQLGAEVDVPEIVLTGLDNVGARREIQQIWPALIIDGAIGPVSCEATLHPWGPDLSCLMCDFEEPSHSALASQSFLTGISEERIQDASAIIDTSDVEAAPETRKAWLRARIGKDVCSVVSDAELEKLATDKQDPQFRPSVPFVACLSSAMMITELVRYLGNAPQELATGFQYDVLVGPHNGIRKNHERKRTCLCVTHRTLIDQVRLRRAKEATT
jgi:hypothetical protein